MEYDPFLLFALVIAGLIAGLVNTLAGGGSMLTLPALMMLGLPADIANATNRIGVLMQSLTGVRSFQRHDQLDSAAIGPILITSMSGALVGSLLASYLPADLLKPVLLGTMMLIAVITLVKPHTLVPPLGSIPYKIKDNIPAATGLFFAGLYGGFIQAGVGFILIAALAGGLRYDLIKTSALKLVCTAAFSFVALIVFVARDQVLWIPGLVLSVGMIFGAVLGVRFTINLSQTALKWILFVMVTGSCVAAYLS